jgi:sec-independent protein translocase protein TatA
MLAPQEILIVGVVAALLFGAKRLPELGRSLGEGMREFKKSIRSVSLDDEEEAQAEKRPPSEVDQKQ